MRSALLLLCACSASADPKPPLPRADVTFRWAATPIDCQHSLEGRSNTSRCYGNDANKTFIVVGYAPTGPSDSHIQVMRYEGVTASAPQRWTAVLELGAHPGDPIVAVRESVVAVAAISDGAVHLALLSTSDGKAIGAPRLIIERDAARVQVVANDVVIQLHVLMRDGSGRVVVLDQTGKPIAARDVTARMLRVKMDPAASPADAEASVTLGGAKVAAAWDGGDLVVKHPRWTSKLVEADQFRMQALTLHATADRVIATLHHGASSGALAIALDAKGSVAWKRTVTGIGPVVHSAYYNRVASRLDGDLFVVQGYEAGGTYVCTLSIADGVEHACVDHLPANAVVDPGAPRHTPKSRLPAQPIGPQMSGLSCTRLGNPGADLTVKRTKPDAIRGQITTPSATCKPKLYGGITGDRIELEVYDGGDKPGAPACTCTFQFTQAIRPESKTVIARVRGGVQLGTRAVPAP